MPRGRGFRPVTVILSVIGFVYILSPHLGDSAISASMNDWLPWAPQSFDSFDVEPELRNWRAWNSKAIDDMTTCMARNNCRRNQEKVVLAFTNCWSDAIMDGWRGGEGVWALSMFRAMRELGYTVLMGKDGWDQTLATYRLFPDQVKVIVTAENIDKCIKNEQCVKSDTNPTGIPRWKSEFSMAFFPDTRVRHGLEYKWVLTADRLTYGEEDSGLQQYIGYSHEAECMEHDMIPHRARQMVAWVLAKQATLFHLDPSQSVIDKSFFGLAVQEPKLQSLEFRGAYQINEHYQTNQIFDHPLRPVPNITNLGKIGPDEFLEQVAQAKIMVGIGNPDLSPSPYLSLCLGTPFINPIKSWDIANPDDRSKWVSQHMYLKWLDPPYVYNVRAHDYDGFVAAIQAAIAHPPGRYIDPPMRRKSVRKRVERLVETDWRSQAETYLDELRAEGRVVEWTL